MYRPPNWKTLQPYSKRKPPEGYYIGVILDAIEGRAKQTNEPLLELRIDIDEGEFKGFYQRLSRAMGKTILLAFKQLTENENTLPYFKKCINDIEASNAGFEFNFNAMELINKRVGIILISEEYVRDGKVKDILKIRELCTIEEVREQNGKPFANNVAPARTNPTNTSADNDNIAFNSFNNESTSVQNAYNKFKADNANQFEPQSDDLPFK